MTRLEILVVPMTAGGGDPETQVFEGGSYAEDKDGAFYFWATGVRFPAPGRYLLRVTSPGLRSCGRALSTTTNDVMPRLRRYRVIVPNPGAKKGIQYL